ncbi:hypothetical protein TanjilG_14697 [Lupinus angustifolius]|uniref:Uncharacterized protein n=1 Tax=Lupinus angustifolius TaxID=3871 RepID=A0A1J7GSF5_LUPAN|nr:hypothetical protein TanjilG_14697 [Lupinus angustifolius]
MDSQDNAAAPRRKENSMKARHKVEKKVSASQIAFGDGGEASSFKSYGFAKGGSNINGSQSSASNAVREKDYKEPWRRPYAGNPASLPIFKGSAGGEDANENSKPSKGSKNATKPCKLNELPSGIMGKMLVYKIGKIKMKLGDSLYRWTCKTNFTGSLVENLTRLDEVSPGMNCMFSQEAVAVNTAQKHCCTIGEIGKHVTVTPDIDAVLDQLTDL